VYTTLAAIHGSRGDFARAEPLYRSALSHLEKNYGSRQVEVGLIAGNLADIYRVQERHGEAIVLYRKAIAVFQSITETDNWQLLWARSGLMASCASTGRMTEAESLSKVTLDSAERLLAATDPRLSTVLHRLALVKLSQQDLVGARMLLERALPILEAAYGAESPRMIAPLQTYAQVLRASKDRRRAKLVETRIQKMSIQSGHPHL
jgi:tetratricopeptide (TPR) repeat protein